MFKTRQFHIVSIFPTRHQAPVMQHNRPSGGPLCKWHSGERQDRGQQKVCTFPAASRAPLRFPASRRMSSRARRLARGAAASCSVCAASLSDVVPTALVRCTQSMSASFFLPACPTDPNHAKTSDHLQGLGARVIECRSGFAQAVCLTSSTTLVRARRADLHPSSSVFWQDM
jgi:hypothetical protein